MQLDRFKHEFKRLNGVYATDKVVLFRNPLELYSLTTGRIIASFNSLDEALHFEIDGKTLEQHDQRMDGDHLPRGARRARRRFRYRF